MKLFEIDVTVYGTAYVRAESADDAVRMAHSRLHERGIEVMDSELISGKQFDDPDLPEVSLSPAMTIAEIGDHAELTD